MALEADLILDRRRLARRLVFWRTVAVLAVVACVLVVLRPSGGFMNGRFGFGGAAKQAASALGGGYVARLPVNGIITDDPKLVAALRGVATDADAAGLIVAIDSPWPGARRCTMPSKRSPRSSRWSPSWAAPRPPPAT
jgi:protease-4